MKPQKQRTLMSLLLNKLLYLIRMMDAAVIKDENAARPWVRISEGYLHLVVCLVLSMTI